MTSTHLLRLAGCASLLMIASCATSIERPAPESYELRVADNVAKRQFDVTLKSHADRALCVSVEAWPSSDGSFPTATDEVVLIVGQDELPVRSELFSAYCPGGCGEHRIEPRGELSGFLAYDAFGDAEQLAASPNKRLRFQVSPAYCRK